MMESALLTRRCWAVLTSPHTIKELSHLSTTHTGKHKHKHTEAQTTVRGSNHSQDDLYGNIVTSRSRCFSNSITVQNCWKARPQIPLWRNVQRYVLKHYTVTSFRLSVVFSSVFDILLQTHGAEKDQTGRIVTFE